MPSILCNVTPSVELLGLMSHDPQFLNPDPRPLSFQTRLTPLLHLRYHPMKQGRLTAGNIR